MRVVVDRDALNTPSWEVSKTAMSFDTLKAKGFHRRLWPDGIRIAEPQIARNAGDASKLLRVHVARLAGNSGVAIVLCIAHAVVDAKGAVAFMKHWADCCRRRNHLVVSSTASPSPPQQTCAALLCLRSVMYEKLSQDARPHVHCLGTCGLYQCYWWQSFRYWVSLSKETSPCEAQEATYFEYVVTSSIRSKIWRQQGQRPPTAYPTTTSSLPSSQLHTRSARCKKSQPRHRRPKVAFSGKKHHKPAPLCPVTFDIASVCPRATRQTAPSETLLRPMAETSVMEVARFSRSTTSAADGATIEKLIQRAMRSIRLLGDKIRILYSLMICQAFSNQSRLPFYEVDFGVGRPVFVSPMAHPRTLAVIVPPPPPSLAMGRDTFVYLTLEYGQMSRVLGNGGFTSFARVIY